MALLDLHTGRIEWEGNSPACSVSTASESHISRPSAFSRRESSDTAALGADLAYRYGRSGSLAGMGFDAVQGMLASGSFGTTAQTLQPSAALDAGLRRLG